MSCPYIQQEDHRIWRPRTSEEYEEALKLAGPKDPVWDWEGWRWPVWGEASEEEVKS